MEKELYTGFHGVKDVAPEVLRGECVIDVTLPDYQPEIRRIYSASASVRPSGKYVSGGKAEFAGTVVHTVLCGNADGGISVLSLPGDYLFSFPVPDGCDPVLLPVTPDAPICRLTGPRRIQIRTPLSAAARCYREKESSPALPTLSADPDVIPLIHSVPSHRVELLSLRDVRLSDVIRTERETKVFSGEATACAREVTLSPAGCEVRGEVDVILQTDAGGGAPVPIRRKIPFSEVIPWEGDPMTGGSASAWATVSSLDLTPSDGERGSEIACDLTLDLLAEATCPKETRALVDLFSVREPLAVKTGKIGVTDVCFCGGGVFTLEGDAERSECNCEDAMTALGESAVVTVADASLGEEGATVSGECRIFATVGSPSGEPDGGTVYSAVNFRFPFSVLFPIPADCRAAGRIDATAIPISVSLRLDPSRLLASVETAITVRVRSENETAVVESVERGEGELPERAPGEIVAVYPAGGETLWEIAGKYGASPREIARQNDLPDGAEDAPDAPNSLDGVVRLLIG